MKKTKLGAVAKDSSAAYGDVDVESCPICFALVASQDAERHARWHEDGDKLEWGRDR